MIRRVTSKRRLLRKRVYKAPHTRHRNSTYYREKNFAKPFQEPFKEMNGPRIKRKRRPKREVDKGFKRSYRIKYYLDDDIIEEDEEEIE